MATEAITPEELDKENNTSLVPEEPTEEVAEQPPKKVNHTCRRHGRLLVAGEGKKPSAVMFVATSLSEEEATESSRTLYGGIQVRAKPRYLKGPAGAIFKDVAARAGLDVDELYYTALVKHLLPKNERMKPKKPSIEWSMPALYAEIKEVKPKIIVCLGKPVFDALFPGMKLSLSDMRSAWFYHPDLKCHVYASDDVFRLVLKPETIERVRVDMEEVKRMVAKFDGTGLPDIPLDYTVVTSSQQLSEVVDLWIAKDYRLMSLDCEWKGRNHIDGQLRSLQVATEPGKGWYIRFMDDKGNYVFDVDYKTAGAIIGRSWNREEVGYCGHHVSADLPWINHVLGLPYYQKTVLDTEFALQLIDEYEDLGLERLSLRYTTLGRYDIDLLIWRKTHKGKEEDGFAFIPDEILIPYAIKDADVVIRAFPQIIAELYRQNLLAYYNAYVNPFVSDHFTMFSLEGMNMDIPRMDALRKVYHHGRRRLEEKFKRRIYEEAIGHLRAELTNLVTNEDEEIVIMQVMEQVLDCMHNGRQDDAVAELKRHCGAKCWPGIEPFWKHLEAAPTFNIRSTDQMRRWLFQIKKLTPIKSTNNKEKGLPAIPWERVMNMPPEAQKQYQPSTDKQSLKILGQGDSAIQELLRLNAVGNICKAFLKEAEITELEAEDGETIQQVKEKGLHYWVASDKRLHGMMSCTETGRPRSWNPNIYNLPSWVNEAIAEGIREVLAEDKEKGLLDPAFEEYLEHGVPSIRSCAQASDGWDLIEAAAKTMDYEELLAYANTLPNLQCFVESDYATAEIRGMAFMSGDLNLINIITMPDVQFAVIKGGDMEKYTRLSYAGDCGIPLHNQDPRLIMAKVDKGGKITGHYDPKDLEVDVDGNLVHPKNDLHWSLGERINQKPRELLNKKKDRGAAKVGNFCLAAGELVLTQRGSIAIQNVLGCDLLWDGVEWVSHEGVICTGTREVHWYQGLWATDNHEVWTAEQGKVSFGEARAQCLTLVRSAEKSSNAFDSRPGDIPGDCTEVWKRVLLCPDTLSPLRSPQGEGAEEHGEGAILEVPVQGSAQASGSGSGSGAQLGGSLRGHEAALQQGHTRVEPQLQGPRDQGAVQDPAGVCLVGAEQMAGGGLQGEGLRPQGQQRALRAEQSAARGSNDQPAEHAGHSGDKHRDCESLHGEAPRSDIHGADGLGVSAGGLVGAEVAPASCYQSKGSRTTQVYDILNAGPRHRFTCSGVLVSNSSAYGASPKTLELKIESDTGEKPAEGTGQAILDALQARQPMAEDWLLMLEKAPETSVSWRAASGRIRHFALHPENISGIAGHLKKSVLGSMGRQMRNFPMQNSVADTAAKAAVTLLAYYRKSNIDAVPLLVLYDSVVTRCHLRDRFTIAPLHQRFMTDENCWEHHGRKWNYPAEHEFVTHWSESPKGKIKQLLQDERFVGA